VRHSEANPSKTDAAHLLQIWILPERRGIEPGYEQKEFPAEEKRGKLRLIASPDGKDKSVTIHQDAKLYVSLLKPGEHVQHELPNDRYGWLQVAKGTVELNGKPLQQGDGAAISEEPKLEVKPSKRRKFCFLIWRDIAHTWDGGSQAATSVPLLRYFFRGTVLCTVMPALFQRKRAAVSVPAQLLQSNIPVIDGAELAALYYSQRQGGDFHDFF